jgi:hypothetical protein
LAGVGAACVACSAIPVLGGAAIGAGATGLASGSGWDGLALLAVGAVVAGAITLRPRRAVEACGASSGCGCTSPVKGGRGTRNVEETVPIACTLAGDDFAGRTKWIRRLTNQYLVSFARTPLSLRLTYAPAAAGQVKELVQKEQACCAFLRFDLRETKDAIHLTVTAPEEAREGIDFLFDHFAPDVITDRTDSSLERPR